MRAASPAVGASKRVYLPEARFGRPIALTASAQACAGKATGLGTARARRELARGKKPKIESLTTNSCGTAGVLKNMLRGSALLSLSKP
jgi:hypothetical protein